MHDSGQGEKDEKMIPQQELIGMIRSLKGELATRYDVREIGIIGVAEQDNELGLERVRFLVEFGPDADLVTQVGLRDFLGDQLGMKIQVVSKGGLRPGMREEVMREVVFV